DLELAVGDEFGKDWSRGTEFLDHHPNVGTNGISDRIAGHSPALIDCRLDETHEHGDVTFSVAALDSRGYGAAAFVAQYDQQRNVQMLSAVFQASDLSISRDVPRDAHDKQVAEALIENNLRWHARISTTENLGVRMLFGDELPLARDRLVRVLILVV